MDPATDDPGRRRARAGAEAAWSTLAGMALRTDRRGHAQVLDRRDGAAATLWPYSQVLHAAVVHGDLVGDPEPARGLGRGLERYRRGDAYMSERRPRRGVRFFDDNAWVGLAAAHAHALGEGESVDRLARRVLAWVQSGEVSGAGVRWREGRPSVHACSTGSAGVLAARLGDPAFAARCEAVLTQGLMLRSGLVADHNDRGRVDPTVWSYNQGLAVGLLVLAGGDGDGTARVEPAAQLAGRTLDHFAREDRLWRQPPCFVGVLGRMLLLLHSVDGDERWVSAVDGYLERVWDTALREDGVTGGGIGSYGSERTLDLAGVVVLAALRAADRSRWSAIC